MRLKLYVGDWLVNILCVASIIMSWMQKDAILTTKHLFQASHNGSLGVTETLRTMYSICDGITPMIIIGTILVSLIGLFLPSRSLKIILFFAYLSVWIVLSNSISHGFLSATNDINYHRGPF